MRGDRAGRFASSEPEDQLPDAIDDGADAALADESGVIGVMAGDEASIDGLLAAGLIALLALVSGAVVVVALGAGVSDVLEQPASEKTAAKATAESVVRVWSRVIVSSCPVWEWVDVVVDGRLSIAPSANRIVTDARSSHEHGTVASEH